jgi:enoyl-CoA hydratase
MSFETILTETIGSVGLITLNRPKALNALNQQLTSELATALDGFEQDPAIGAIVLTGSERAFAAGADIKEMKDKGFVQAYTEDFINPAGWERVTLCRKPVIAAVAGWAVAVSLR